MINQSRIAEFEHVEEWVVGLYDSGALGCAETREEFIKLKCERMSPHYANFRGTMSVDYSITHGGMTFDQQMRVRDLTIDAGVFVIDEIAASRNFDHLAPIPQAVTQLGGAIALKANISSLNVRVREDEQGYGKHKPVEGHYSAGEKVIGFDDVVTLAETKEEFEEPIQAVSLNLLGFAVLLDRQEGGRANIKKRGLTLNAATGMYEVKDILRDNGRITTQQHDFIEEYLEQYGDLRSSA